MSTFNVPAPVRVNKPNRVKTTCKHTRSRQNAADQLLSFLVDAKIYPKKILRTVLNVFTIL